MPQGIDPRWVPVQEDQGIDPRWQPVSTSQAPESSGFIPDEDWAKLSGGEKLRNMLQWGGRALGGAVFGPAGVDAANNPKTTMATAAIGPATKVVKAVAPKAVELVRRGAGISSERAAANMQAASQASQNVPVSVDKLTEPLVRAIELSETSRLPRVVTRLVSRVNAGPLNWRQAEDFVSTMSRLSANDFNSLTPQMQRQVIAIRDALRESMEEAAETVGKGDQYMSGVREYAKAARANKALDKARKTVLPPLVQGAGLGAAGTLIYKLLGIGEK